nr:hypothetical protein [Mycolicibacterium austroafricanum]
MTARLSASIPGRRGALCGVERRVVEVRAPGQRVRMRPDRADRIGMRRTGHHGHLVSAGDQVLGDGEQRFDVPDG